MELLVCDIRLIEEIGFVIVSSVESDQEIDQTPNREDVSLSTDHLAVGNFRGGEAEIRYAGELSYALHEVKVDTDRFRSCKLLDEVEASNFQLAVFSHVDVLWSNATVDGFRVGV